MISRQLRILVIEDEPIAQRALLSLLEKKGCITTLAVNSKQALELCEGNYQLIFIDWGLPEMDGFDLAAQIRQVEKNKSIPPRPIIMVSAYSEEDDTQKKCGECGIDEYYIKPLYQTDFDAIVKKYGLLNFL